MDPMEALAISRQESLNNAHQTIADMQTVHEITLNQLREALADNQQLREHNRKLITQIQNY